MSLNVKQRILKVLSKIRFTNLVADHKQAIDPSIVQLEKLMKSVGLKTPDSDQSAKGHLQTAVIWLFIIQSIRSTTYFYAKYVFKNQLMLDIIGDYFATVGIGGDVFQFWFVMYSLVSLNIAYAMKSAGHVLYDFGNSSNLVKTTMSSKDIRSFRFATRLSLLLAQFVLRGLLITATAIHLYAFYRSYSIRRTPIMFGVYCLSMGLMWIWIYASCIY